jgi:hypothetical protein
MREKDVVACVKQPNTIFIQSAYAMIDCFCPSEYIFSPTDSIKTINIFTLNDFDNQHSENSDITDYFKVAHSYSSVKNHVANMQFTFEYDIETKFEPELKIDLMLMTVPTANNNQQFKIQVVLSDGRIFEQQTPEIKLL